MENLASQDPAGGSPACHCELSLAEMNLT